MSNIHILNVVTKLDIPVDRVINSLKEANLAEVVVCGVDKDGEFYFASNLAGGGDVLWWIELAKKKLMDLND